MIFSTRTPLHLIAVLILGFAMAFVAFSGTSEADAQSTDDSVEIGTACVMERMPDGTITSSGC